MVWRSTLLIAAAITMLPGHLAAQSAGGSAEPPAQRKVVVESRGEVHLGRSVPFDGVVSDTASGTPLGDARVELLGTDLRARSTEDGRFRFGAVPAGRYSVRVTRMGYEPVVLDDVLVRGEQGDSAFSVVMRQRAVGLSEMVITPGQFGLLHRGISASRYLSRESLESVPQLGEDIYRAVARAPGVTTDDFSAKFGVRGASGDELYVSLDGLELVEPFHMKDVGGAFSIIDIQTLGTASLNTGGFSAEYGDKLGGVFTLTTSDPRTDGVHGSVAVSAMNARATMQGGFAGGKGGWMLSARPGYLDVALKATEMRDSIQPPFYDARLRMQSVVSGSAISWHRHGEDYSRTGQQDALIDDARSLERIGIRQDWTLDASRSVLFKWGIDAKRESATYDYLRVMGVRQADGSRSGRNDSLSTMVAPRADKLAL